MQLLALPLLLALTPVAQDPAPEEGADIGDRATTRGLTKNLDGAYQGYTLIAPLRMTKVLLLDMEGQVVHEWETGLAPAGGIYLLENGNLIAPVRPDENERFNGGGIGGIIREYTWDGELVWEYVIADDYATHHHDVEPLPNGNLLAIAWEHRYREDAIAYGRHPDAVGEPGMWPDAVLELKPVRPDGAEVVWEWHAWDHLVQDHDETKDGYDSVADRPELIDINYDHRGAEVMTEEERQRLAELEEQMRALGYTGEDEEEDEDAAPGGLLDGVPDWMHTNAVDYHPELDLIVLSSPELNEILVIDHSLPTEDTLYSDGGRWGQGGGILWRWGNPQNYGLGDETDRRLFYQHDPQWIVDGSGEAKLTVYNNGGGRPDGDWSSVEELHLPFDPEQGFLREKGQPFGPAEPAWEYSAKGDFYSSFISGAQVLPNGNVLICAGAPGRLFEVDRAGNVVWEYLNEHVGDVDTGSGGGAPPIALFRGTRYGMDYPGLRGRL